MIFQRLRPHECVQFQPVQPVGQSAQFQGAFECVVSVHHSLHALSVPDAPGNHHDKIGERLTCA